MVGNRKTLDWGGNGGLHTEGTHKKRIWRNSIFSCNHQLQECFSVCSRWDSFTPMTDEQAQWTKTL
jgi:hypothetical protein